MKRKFLLIALMCLVFHSYGQNITTIAGNGTSGNSGDGGAATAAMLISPIAAALDSMGNVYVVDMNADVIRKVTPNGTISTVAGGGSVLGDGGPATAAQISSVMGIGADNNGNIYIADAGHNRIRKVNSSGIISTIAGTGTGGSTGDGGDATAAKVNQPMGVTADGYGNIYIADYANHKVRKINSSGIISTIAGTGTAGSLGDGGSATAAELNHPHCTTVDGLGNIYVAEYTGNRVRKVTPAGIISTIAGTGTAGFSGDGGPATAAQLNASSSVGVDSSGNVYIAEFGGNQRVRIVNTSGIISTVAGNNTVGYSGDGGPATAAELGNWLGIAVSKGGGVFIADGNNHRLRLVFGNITGSTSVCAGNTITLSETSPFGTWGSGNTAIATIDAAGIVTGVSGGAVSIDYTVGNSTLSYPITINPLANPGTITGAASLCVGANITLHDTISGGTWSINNSRTTIVDSVVSGVTAGIDTIIYSVTNSCGTQVSTHIITVNPLANPGVITGASNVCVGASITLNDTVSGGTGSISNGMASLLDSVVTGVTPGVDTVSYSVTNGCGTEIATHIISINPLPDSGSITGVSSVCVAAHITLTDGISGGTWSVTNTKATHTGGIITGAIAGLDTIKYAVTNVCGTATATKVITINPLPHAASINGTNVVCVGSTTSLTDSVINGIWQSASTSLATIDTSGLVLGVSAGFDTIRYSYTNVCGTDVAWLIVTINPLPDSGMISGIDSVCAGVSITLHETVFGGTWSTSNSSISIFSDSVVTGISAGTDSVIYTVTNSCGTAVRGMVMITKPQPVAGILSGTDSVCTGTTVTISSTSPDGIWFCLYTNATVSDGVVTGITAGMDTLVYKVTNYCGVDSAKQGILVKPQPFAGMIYGMDSVCVDATTTLMDSAIGGMWSINDTIHATILGGVVTGHVAGTDSVHYIVTNYCGTATNSVLVVVNPLPFAGIIKDASDTFTLCVGAHRLLTDSIMGGLWTAKNTNATVIDSTGYITGATAGTDSIFYTVHQICGIAIASKVITVNPLPSVSIISGDSIVCVGAIISLTDSIAGGFWLSRDTLNAKINTDGIVIGIHSGVDTIVYRVINMCGIARAKKPITVNPLPVTGTISGSTIVCVGSSILLSDTSTGGTWYVSNSNALDTNGKITGQMPGTDTVKYVVTNSCGKDSTSMVINVNAVPTPVITRSSDTLSTVVSYTSYKWYKLGDTTVLSTNAYYVATDTGHYLVVVADGNDCSNNSALYWYKGLSVVNVNTSKIDVTIYPNPTQSIINIVSPVTVDALLSTIEGRLILEVKDAKTLDLSNLPNGIYLITVIDNQTNTKLKSEKILKTGN